MKNIKEILAEAGIEVTDEQMAKVEAGVKENYKTASDYDKQKEKLQASDDKVKALTESLEKFKDVDPEALKGEIDKLKGEIAQKDADYAAKISDRDFEDIVKGAISAAGGLNSKAIRSLLDIDALKASKNQQTDVEAAVKALTEAEDSKMLFKNPETEKVDAIGKVGGSTKDNSLETSIMKSMGLSVESKEK